MKYIIIAIIVAYILYYVLEKYSGNWLSNLIRGKYDKDKEDENRK